jgi:hypothetical protein
MSVSQAVLIAALVAAPVASAAAAPIVRLGPSPIVFAHPPGERPAFSPPGGGGLDAWGHRHRRDFVGPVAPAFGAPEPGFAAPPPLFVSAPLVVSVTLAAPGGGPAAVGWAPGPEIIEVGEPAPPHGRLPLIIYGD